MIELKPCPFCGRAAIIKEFSNGYKANGKFTASYSCGCKNCEIFFKDTSIFVLEHGKPKFEHDGYEEVVNAWNKRVNDKSSGKQICGTCRWHKHEDISDGWVCVNDQSDHRADWTGHDDTCDEWEGQEK